MPSVVQHSHRATTKVSHKPFKSRKATKGSLRQEAKGMWDPTFQSLFRSQNVGVLCYLQSCQIFLDTSVNLYDSTICT